MKVTAKDVQEAVVAKDDFAHEMRTLRVLREFSKLQWRHGGTYIDNVTKKPRQFDFRAL